MVKTTAPNILVIWGEDVGWQRRPKRAFLRALVHLRHLEADDLAVDADSLIRGLKVARQNFGRNAQW